MKKAQFWEREKENVRCRLCPHNCLLLEDKTGVCRTKKNIDNELFSLNYGRITSLSLDPIEKKPLYHFYPGSYILSVGTFGCNLKCAFCQNHEISQDQTNTVYSDTNELLKIVGNIGNNLGVAFTYNEPLMWYEYIIDFAPKFKRLYSDKKIVLVTNGFINEEPLIKLLPYIDALNIDLKAFTDNFYRKICKGKLSPVLETIKHVYNKCHLEVTTLIVTDENDSAEEIEMIGAFLGTLDKNIPLHLSRYHPDYLMKTPATPVERLIEAKKIAEKHVNYVYLGNVYREDNNTYCPACGSMVYSRDHDKSYLIGNSCPECGSVIPLIFT